MKTAILIYMNKNINICNNCGKQGHSFNQCKLPIISYGIILFRSSVRGLEFLMIRRKDSFGYIDFMRGKYSPYNICHLQNIIDEMSISEKNMILEYPFEKLWKQMWGTTFNSQFKNEENASSKKMEIIKNGININEEMVTLKDIVEKSSTSWHETEWEFPKGRRNHKEKDIECALREFEEETGISQSKITIIDNVLPFEEIFIGSNHKSYKHKYFLAYIDEAEELLSNFQITEVSKLEWKTIDECLQSIRPYNLEKKKLIININKVLQEYRLYS
jgi:8-oxo-dGTP pyrophosphatase MutT (NUDIX family)